MKRRDILKGMGLLPFVARTMFSQKSVSQKIIKPKRLRAGDTVAIIAPSSGISADELAKALQNMTDLGFRAKVG
ncbi:MAG: LD-carboxypeptidase, partial [Pyrinomonadaceae bacterium]